MIHSLSDSRSQMGGSWDGNTAEQQPRRMACDRCRGQKLRCDRGPGANINTPCRRCLKSRVPECVTTKSTRSEGRWGSGRSSFDGGRYYSSSSSLRNLAAGEPRCPEGMNEDTAAQPQLESRSGSYDEISTSGEDQSYGGRPNSSPAFPTANLEDAKDRNLGKLADLSSNLFKQLNSIQSGRMAEVHTPNSAQSMESYASSNQTYSAAAILNSAQEFLEILEKFMQQNSNNASHMSPAPLMDHPPENAYAYSADDQNILRNAKTAYYEQNGTQFHHTFGPLMSTDFMSQHPAISPQTMTTTSISPTYHANIQLDFPTMLNLTSSYVCLMRIFQAVLSEIHSSLLAQIPSLSIFPELNLHPTLQARLLVEMCMDVLSRIEKDFRGVGGGMNEEIVREEGSLRGAIEALRAFLREGT